MSTAEYQPRPVRVSPTIKFARWSFLTVGVLYGLYHQSRLSKKAAELRVIEEQKKVIRDAKLAEEKRIQIAAEMKMIDDLSRGGK